MTTVKFADSSHQGHSASHSKSASDAFVAAQHSDQRGDKGVNQVPNLNLTAAQQSQLDHWNALNKGGNALKTPEVARAALASYEVRKPGEELLQAVKQYAKVFNLGKLEKTLGNGYDFLVQFLKNAENLTHISLDSPQGLELLLKFGKDHAKFVKLVDAKFQELIRLHPEVILDQGLWNRLVNGSKFALAFRVQMVKNLSEKLENAVHFWNRLNAKVNGQFNKQEIETVTSGFFSRFSKGLEKATDKDIADVVNVLKRIRSSKRIAKASRQLLKLTDLNSANQKIHDKGLFLEAPRAQIEFDKHLQKLKVLDAYYSESEKGRSEGQLFEALHAVPLNELPQFLESLSADDRKLAEFILKGHRKQALNSTLQLLRMVQKVSNPGTVLHSALVSDKDRTLVSHISKAILEEPLNAAKQLFEQAVLRDNDRSWSFQLSASDWDIVLAFKKYQEQTGLGLHDALLSAKRLLDQRALKIPGFRDSLSLADRQLVDAVERENPLDPQDVTRTQKLIKDFSGLSFTETVAFKANLNGKDLALIEAFEAKRGEVFHQDAPFNVSARHAQDYVAQQEKRIDKLNSKLLSEADSRLKNLDKDYIHPESYATELLLAKAEALTQEKPAQGLTQCIQERSRQIADLEKELNRLPSDAVERVSLKSEQNRLLALVKLLNKTLTEWQNTKEPATVPLLPFFKDYFVFPVGNVLYPEIDDEGRPQKSSGKWAVLDLSAVSSQKEKDRLVKDVLTPLFLREQIILIERSGDKSFDQVFTLEGGVKLFFETPSVVREKHEDRGVGQRTRIVLANGKFKREIKDPERTAGEGWNKGRELTAAVDRLEAIWTSRLILNDILTGHSGKMDWNTLLHTSEYLAAVEASDLARIGNSYATDDSYRQASTDIFNGVVLSLNGLISERLTLEGITKNNEKRQYDLIGAVKTLTDLINPVKTWLGAIDAFIKHMPPELKPKLKRYITEFTAIHPILEKYYSEFPQELRDMNDLREPGKPEAHQPAIEDYVKSHNVDLDSLVHRTLRGNGPGEELSTRLNALYPYLNNLAVAEASPAIRGKTADILKQSKSMEFTNAARIAIPNSFQLATRVEMPLADVTNYVSELSSLYAEIREEWVAVKQRVFQIERQRAVQTKELLSSRSIERAWKDFADAPPPIAPDVVSRRSPVKQRPGSPDVNLAVPASRSLTIPARRSTTSFSVSLSPSRSVVHDRIEIKRDDD